MKLLTDQDLCHVLAMCSLSMHLTKLVCSDNSPCRETHAFTVHALLDWVFSIANSSHSHSAYTEPDQKANKSLALDFNRLPVGLFHCSVYAPGPAVIQHLSGQSECFYCSTILSGGTIFIMKALTVTLN